MDTIDDVASMIDRREEKNLLSLFFKFDSPDCFVCLLRGYILFSFAVRWSESRLVTFTFTRSFALEYEVHADVMSFGNEVHTNVMVSM